MASTRAFFASVGAGASLVAAAALALLVVGAVFAIGAGGGNPRSATSKSAFILYAAGGRAAGAAVGSQPVATAPVLLRAHPRPQPRPSPQPPRERPERPDDKPASPSPAERPVAGPPIVRSTTRDVAGPQPPIVRSTTRDVAGPQPPIAAVRAGDTVRRVGAGISSAVQSKGETLAAAAAPLGPPVSQAVQDVLDRVAIALERTTDGLAGTLDKILPPKR